MRRATSIAAAVVVVALIVAGVTGQWIFADAREDPLDPSRPVDAVVVLGGEHDGREAYGIALARELGAATVLLSDPYPTDDPVMANLCGRRARGIEVICKLPSPPTTRGEAIMARRLATIHDWSTIAVVTWRYHLPRARTIFAECYAAPDRSTVFRAVPRDYADMPIAMWEYVYAYQFLGFAKNLFQGPCDVESS